MATMFYSLLAARVFEEFWTFFDFFQDRACNRRKTWSTNHCPFSLKVILAPKAGFAFFVSLSLRKEFFHASYSSSSSGFYPDRAAGGYRHHRHPDRPAPARCSEGSRSRRKGPVAEQP